MADSFYSFSEPLNSGVDFFTADDVEAVSIAVAGDISVTVNAIRLLSISANLSADATATVAATRMVLASANISDLLSATATVGTNIREGALIVISATSSLTASSTKIAYASSAINCTTSVAALAVKTALAVSAISSAASIVTSMVKTARGAANVVVSSNLSAIPRKIIFASTALSSNVSLSVAGKLILITIKIVLQNVGSVSATAVKFATSAIAGIVNIDDSLIRTFLLLDESPITNHNRTIDMSVEPIFTEVKNWNNRSSRYYKSSSRAARRTFNLSWSWLPNSNSSTVDGKKGRDFIKDIASDPRSHVLKIINLDDSGTTPYTETSYNVLVKDYSETLIRRDIENGVYFWDCSISLEEV
jgi:hypothetical protein